MSAAHAYIVSAVTDSESNSTGPPILLTVVGDAVPANPRTVSTEYSECPCCFADDSWVA